MRRLARVSVALLLVLAVGGSARADTWMPPVPIVDTSQDGGWYVVAQPGGPRGGPGAEVLLVRRAEGAPPRVAPPRPGAGGGEVASLEPEPGDRLLARVAIAMPFEVRCLDGGRGFVLIDHYGNLGYGDVLELRGPDGALRWGKALKDLFSRSQIGTFRHSVSSIWWSRAFWVDEERQEVVAAWQDETKAGVLRVGIADGRVRAAPLSDLLGRIGRGSGPEQAAVLQLAAELDLPGLDDAVKAAWARPELPALARAHVAGYLLAHGDETVVDALRALAARGQPAEARRVALAAVAPRLGAEGIPLLLDALRADDQEVWYRGEEGLRMLGAAAVDALVRLLLDTAETEHTRLGAAHALWNMDPAASAPALTALDEVARGEGELADAARSAAQRIRQAAEENDR